MKKDAVYESNISTARWLIYDIPGNAGWIIYLVCLIRCLVNRPEYMGIPLVQISLIIGILPATAMVVGIAELISERIRKLDRILPKARLYRGFGTLTWGGFGGMIGLSDCLFQSTAGWIYTGRVQTSPSDGGRRCSVYHICRIDFQNFPSEEV